MGTPRTFGFPAKDHVDLGAGLGQLDFDTAAKLAGARFVVLKKHIARMHRAKQVFVVDKLRVGIEADGVSRLEHTEQVA